MAQHTLLDPPVNPLVERWIASHRDTINATAQVLGVSPTAIALAVGEEASHILSAVPLRDENGDPMPGLYGPGLAIKDFGQDVLISRYHSDSQVTQDFFDRASDIVAGVKPSGDWREQFKHPTMMDVGWGNLNVGNSILLLQGYLNQTGVGRRYEGDPLGLAKYGSDYSKFVGDIVEPNSGLTFKIAALNVAGLNESFARNYGSQYTNLTQDQKDGYLVTGYKQGRSKIEGNVARNTIDGIPTLPEVSAGDGGNFAIRNYNTVRDILGSSSGRRSSGDDLPENSARATKFADEANPFATVFDSVLANPRIGGAAPIVSRPLYEAQSFVAPPPDAVGNGEPVRRLGVRTADASGGAVFDSQAPAVPFVAPGVFPLLGSSATFDEPFQASLPSSGASAGGSSRQDLDAFRQRWLQTFLEAHPPALPQEASVPVVPDRQNDLDSGASGGFASPVRYLSRRVIGGPDSFASYFDSPPLSPSDEMLVSGQPASPSGLFGNRLPHSVAQPGSEQTTTLPGLASGEPMDYSLRPWIAGFPHTPAPDDEDWLMQLLAPRRGR